MKKLFFLSLLISVQFSAYGQFIMQFAKVTGNKGDIVGVDVSAKNFTNIATTEYSVNYDSLVLEIQDITNQNSKYDVNYNTHLGGTRAKNGQIIFSWNAADGNGKNIPDNERLFTIRFKLIGKECDSSAIKFSNDPVNIEILNGNLDPVNTSSVEGQVKINGAACPPGGGNSDLMIKASMETAAKGTIVCWKITVCNFTDIANFQFSMHWDGAIAQFSSIRSGALTGIENTIAPFPTNDGLRVLWEPADAKPVTLPDHTVIFEICVTAVGNSGSMTTITFDGNPIPAEAFNSKGEVPITFQSGKLTVTTAAKALKLYVKDTMVVSNQDVCIPILVDGFSCVDAFQFGMKFDSTKLKFKSVNTFNVGCLGAGNFNVKRDTIIVAWDKNTCPSQTLPNGSHVFYVCFEAVDTCPYTTPLSFIDLASGPIEFEDCNSEIFAITRVAGNIMVKCPVASPCNVVIGNVFSPTCFGGSDGKIVGNSVTGGVSPFTYQWVSMPGRVPVPGPLNPTNFPAGRYILIVTDRGNNNGTCESAEIVIRDPDKITLGTVTITHETCLIRDGKIIIEVSEIKGGLPPYKYAWRRCGTQTSPLSTSHELLNVSGNCYSVEVRDSNNCSIRDSFTVNKPPVCPPTFNLVTKVKCFGDCNGSVFANATGGSTPYIFRWSSGNNITANPVTGLCAGIVTLTITDGGGNTSTGTYQLIEPAQIDIKVDSTKSSSGTNGEIYVTVSGGAGMFTKYEWKNSSNQIIGSSEDLKGLAPGTYTLCATDKDTCTQCIEVIVNDAGSANLPVITNITVDKTRGNTDVTCRDVCDGSVTVQVQNGTPPYTYSILPVGPNGSGPRYTAMCPGNYTVTVTDAALKTGTKTVTINNVPSISITARRVSCATNTTATDGNYVVSVSGGSSPYSIKWCNGEVGTSNNTLAPGQCSVEVTDINGCKQSDDFTVCVDTNDPDCYKGRLVISPNDDGLNDFLTIQCTETSNNSLVIYDRWGNQVYSAKNYLNTFEGENNNGEILEEGTYMWVLKVVQPGIADQYYKGTVTIVR